MIMKWWIMIMKLNNEIMVMMKCNNENMIMILIMKLLMW